VVTDASVVLVGDSVASMVLAAQRAQRAPGLRLAIVGGLAVTCRLGRVHRATGDVDVVADEVVDIAADSGAQVLIDSGVALPDPTGPDHRVFIDGTKLEIIDTVALPSDASEIEPELSRLFVLAHRWALESAEPMRVIVADADVDAALQVAVPAALVATKLHGTAIGSGTRSARRTRTTSIASSRRGIPRARSLTQ